MSRILAQLDSRFETGPASTQPRVGSAGGTALKRIVRRDLCTEGRRVHRQPVLLRLVLVASSRFGLASRRSSSAHCRRGPLGGARRALRRALR